MSKLLPPDDHEPDARASIDARLDSPGREGLTGTASANMYKPLQDSDDVTIAPDWRPMREQPKWRKDFPIDWPQDNYVERREFMKFMVLTSLALMVGQFWIAAKHWLGGSEALDARRIASLSDIPVGSVLTFAYPGETDDCILIRMTETKLLAYSQKCTHLSCAVRPLVDQGVIHCPCHEGYFDLESGRPIAGPPPRPLPIIHLELRGNDIYATGVEVRTV